MTVTTTVMARHLKAPMWPVVVRRLGEVVVRGGESRDVMVTVEVEEAAAAEGRRVESTAEECKVMWVRMGLDFLCESKSVSEMLSRRTLVSLLDS